jgi:hypothetical protein
MHVMMMAVRGAWWEALLAVETGVWETTASPANTEIKRHDASCTLHGKACAQDRHEHSSASTRAKRE